MGYWGWLLDSIGSQWENFNFSVTLAQEKFKMLIVVQVTYDSDIYNLQPSPQTDSDSGTLHVSLHHYVNHLWNLVLAYSSLQQSKVIVNFLLQSISPPDTKRLQWCQPNHGTAERHSSCWVLLQVIHVMFSALLQASFIHLQQNELSVINRLRAHRTFNEILFAVASQCNLSPLLHISLIQNPAFSWYIVLAVTEIGLMTRGDQR